MCARRRGEGHRGDWDKTGSCEERSLNRGCGREKVGNFATGQLGFSLILVYEISHFI